MTQKEPRINTDLRFSSASSAAVSASSAAVCDLCGGFCVIRGGFEHHPRRFYVICNDDLGGAPRLEISAA
jgi:hypothetical protein